MFAVRAPSGIRVIAFPSHAQALDAGVRTAGETWVLEDHASRFETRWPTLEDRDAVGVWEAEIEEITRAVGPPGFGVDVCEFHAETMLVRVVDSADVLVECSDDYARQWLQGLFDI